MDELAKDDSLSTKSYIDDAVQFESDVTIHDYVDINHAKDVGRGSVSFSRVTSSMMDIRRCLSTLFFAVTSCSIYVVGSFQSINSISTTRQQTKRRASTISSSSTEGNFNSFLLTSLSYEAGSNLRG